MKINNKSLPTFIFTLCMAVATPAISFAQEQDVIIKISQDASTRLDEFQTNIVLKKKAFKFQVLLNHVEGVYVFASLKDSIYRFSDTSIFYDFSYLKLLELRESDKFNTNRELNVSQTGWSYWFYNDTTEWHSFNRRPVGLGNKGLVCTKAIKELYDMTEGRVIKLKSINSPLYLFFVAVKEYDRDGKPLKELMRRKVKIDWVGNDDDD